MKRRQFLLGIAASFIAPPFLTEAKVSEYNNGTLTVKVGSPEEIFLKNIVANKSKIIYRICPDCGIEFESDGQNMIFRNELNHELVHSHHGGFTWSSKKLSLLNKPTDK